MNLKKLLKEDTEKGIKFKAGNVRLNGEVLKIGHHFWERAVPYHSINALTVEDSILGSRLIIQTIGDKRYSARFSSMEQALEVRELIEECREKPILAKYSQHPLTIIELQSALNECFEQKPLDIRRAAAILIIQGLLMGASDCHLDPNTRGGKIRFRINGTFVTICELNTLLFQRILNRMRILGGLATYVNNQTQESRIEVSTPQLKTDVRLTVFPTIHGDRATLRYFGMQSELLHLDNLGYDDSVLSELKKTLTDNQGLILITGPANSGKTTTAYASLRYVVEQEMNRCNIFTVEDPVECHIDNITQTTLDEARGLDYSQAIRSILRQDPNVIMIGEIRDRETAAAALQASLTGHMVIASFHCGNALEAIIRLIDMGLEPYKISSALRGILSQRLHRQSCICNADKSCRQCHGTGINGRRLSSLWLSIDESIQRQIIDYSSTEALGSIIESKSVGFLKPTNI